VGVGRSQSRGSSLTLRRKCRSSPELKQMPAPLVMTALISRSARTMSSASNHAATSASLRQLRLSGRLRTTRATPASASCSRINSGQALSVRHVSVIAVLLLGLGIRCERQTHLLPPPCGEGGVGVGRRRATVDASIKLRDPRPYPSPQGGGETSGTT